MTLPVEPIDDGPGGRTTVVDDGTELVIFGEAEASLTRRRNAQLTTRLSDARSEREELSL